MSLAQAGPEFEIFAEVAQSLKGGDPLDRDFLLEIWTGAGEDQDRAINHLFDTPEAKVRRVGGKKKKKDKKHGAADASFDLSSFDMSPPPIARSGSRSSNKEKKSKKKEKGMGHDSSLGLDSFASPGGFGDAQWGQDQGWSGEGADGGWGEAGGWDEAADGGWGADHAAAGGWAGEQIAEAGWGGADQGAGAWGGPGEQDYAGYEATAGGNEAIIPGGGFDTGGFDTGGFAQVDDAAHGDIDQQVAETERQLRLVEQELKRTREEIGMMAHGSSGIVTDHGGTSVMHGCAGPAISASTAGDGWASPSMGGVTDSSWDAESESDSDNDWWNQPSPFIGSGDPLPSSQLKLQGMGSSTSQVGGFGGSADQWGQDYGGCAGGDPYAGAWGGGEGAW